MQDTEIWLPIPKWEDLYEISSLGHVKSKRSGKILKPNITYRGYYLVQLYNNKHRESWLIHRLVALAFLENPSNLGQVNHKNGVKTCNYLSNLEWCSRSENRKHAIETGLFSSGWIGDKSNINRIGKNKKAV